MRKKLNKKGELLGEETFGNILAWISISLVIIATLLIYNNFKSAKTIGEATSSLEALKGAALKLNNDVSLSSKEVLIPNPLNWNLVGYDITQTRPGQCSKGSDCICFCPAPSPLKTQIELCVKKGTCIDFPNFKPFTPITIKAGGTNHIILKKLDGEITLEWRLV